MKKDFEIFKIEYYWYEGEHEEHLVGKNADIEEFEKDLFEAKKFAENLIEKEIKEGDYLGKGYRVGCLQEFYEQILWYLTEKLGYIYCNYNKKIRYNIEDNNEGIQVIKSEDRIETKEISY